MGKLRVVKGVNLIICAEKKAVVKILKTEIRYLEKNMDAQINAQVEEETAFMHGQYLHRIEQIEQQCSKVVFNDHPQTAIVLFKKRKDEVENEARELALEIKKVKRDASKERRGRQCKVGVGCVEKGTDQ